MTYHLEQLKTKKTLTPTRRSETSPLRERKKEKLPICHAELDSASVVLLSDKKNSL
jgi:hypothetical protein